MTDIRTIIAELRELEKKIPERPSFVMAGNKPDGDTLAGYHVMRNALPLILDYIAKLEAVADAARGAFDKYEYSFPPAPFDDLRDRLNDLDDALDA